MSDEAILKDIESRVEKVLPCNCIHHIYYKGQHLEVCWYSLRPAVHAMLIEYRKAVLEEAYVEVKELYALMNDMPGNPDKHHVLGVIRALAGGTDAETGDK